MVYEIIKCPYCQSEHIDMERVNQENKNINVVMKTVIRYFSLSISTKHVNPE